jgi:hypothetical protein
VTIVTRQRGVAPHLELVWDVIHPTQEFTMTKTETPNESKSSPDTEIKPTKKADIELTEDELDKVSGGPTAVEYRNNNT